NIIIAPDGISGNLIYRTLVHLGGGKAYGAIYMNLEKVIIDTSRVGELSEIQGALLLALSLS
ncbi:MAG: phosphotransacetylase, partial [Promethearchaeota archaeon]